MRLAQRGERDDEYLAVAFGPGDHRTPTELREAPAALRRGQRLEFDDELEALVLDVDPRAPRLVRLRFATAGARLLLGLYRVGRPVQYAHVPARLALWDVQNRFAARPWALEAPSAGFALDAEQLAALAARGVELARVTHAAGLSSTGSAELDARLPLPERYEIPAETAAKVRAAREGGGRIVAVGTSVVRALESSALTHGEVTAGEAMTELLLGPGTRRRVVDGVLSGLHEPGTSHFSLLESFTDRELLLRGLATAEALGYEAHEFGDACLVLSPLLRSQRRAPRAA
jgi:S-adenosylmethionine:tRNA ribosyltransferase-isomerase